MFKRFVNLHALLLVAMIALADLTGSAGSVSAAACIPNGETDDVLFRTDCCSGYALPDSIECEDPADWGTTWESCSQICASPPPGEPLGRRLCPDCPECAVCPQPPAN